MSLEQCPKMAQTCPHKTQGCDGADGDQCHYVTIALGTSVAAWSQLRAAGLTRQMWMSKEIEALIESRTEEIARRIFQSLEPPLTKRER